jgi:addiction module RelE/StbE family toxin
MSFLQVLTLTKKMHVDYSSQFKKQYKKLPPKIQEQFRKRLELLAEDSTNPQLHVHKLSGEFEGLWSMNVTGDVCAIFDNDYPYEVLFVGIGTHSTFYS